MKIREQIKKRPAPLMADTLYPAGWPHINESDDARAYVHSTTLWPKITIVTPSYNQGVYLEKTILSLIHQNYPNLEFFVVDGQSDDESVSVIRRYEQWIDWWVSEPDKGQSHAINKGLRNSSGDLLGWLNSDDYLFPNALFRIAKAYLEDTSVGAVVGQGHLVTESGRVVHVPNVESVTRESLFQWCLGSDFMQPSCLFSRDAWLECGDIDENLNFAMDVDYWMRIASLYKFRVIPDLLSVSLSHPFAKTTSLRHKSLAETALVCARHGNEKAAKETLDKMITRLEKAKENKDHPLYRRLLRKFRRFSVFRY